jgi:hypothetical protein
VHGSGAIDRDVSASSGRQFEVPPKDRTADLGIDLFKAHFLTPAVSKDGVTPVARTFVTQFTPSPSMATR